MRRAFPALCCALLLVLAGCSVGYRGPAPGAPPDATVPTATPTSASTDAPGETTPATATPRTPTATPRNPRERDSGLFSGDGERPIVVRGGRLPVNATVVYDRTRDLLETAAPRPTAVELLDTTANTTRPPEFQRLLGLERNVSEVEAVAFVVGPRTVYLNRNATDRPAFVEHVLAHEFTHTVQFRRGYIGRVQAATSAGPDGRFASTAVIEGGATYAEDRYWLRHLADGQGGPSERPGRNAADSYRASDGAARYAFAPYWFGYRYANRTLDGPAALPDVYADPPTTGEQVLHPGVEESPVPLRVSLQNATTGTWQETFAPRRGRVGEALLRVALGTELGDDRAARAAAGWGNDTRIAFNNETGARGYAWVLRFDDAANATAFDAAARDYLDGRTGGPGQRLGDRGTRWRTTLDGRPVAYRLVPVDDRTAVLLLGGPAFVAPGTTAVREEAGRVVVATDGRDGRDG